MNILAIGAHPDDIELGCGGVMLKAAKHGHNIFMYTITRGSASGDPVQRTHELMESAKHIGAKTLWIDNFEDTHLSVNSDLINHIEFFINKGQADIVFTHSVSDIHHDHKAVAASTVEAGRFVPNIMSYEMPVTKDFKPQIFYDISDVVEEKVELIKLFTSQRDKIFTKANAIKGLAEYRALQGRLYDPINHMEECRNEAFSHVEAFEVLKLCVDMEFKLWNVPTKRVTKSEIARSGPDEILEVSSVPNLQKRRAMITK